MVFFKRKSKEPSLEIKSRQELCSVIGSGYQTQPNFDEMYRQYTSEQLEELIVSLEETLRFLEYQKALSIAFHKEQYEAVQHLQENKIKGNLAYLEKDEGWRLRVLTKEYRLRQNSFHAE
ncbi:TPA: hypothetical protein ACGOVI_001936 [Streptococcus suis]